MPRPRLRRFPAIRQLTKLYQGADRAATAPLLRFSPVWTGCRATGWNQSSIFALVGQRTEWERRMGRYLLLWLLGVPMPILLLIWAFGGLN
jgi:hypothetical protein